MTTLILVDLDSLLRRWHAERGDDVAPIPADSSFRSTTPWLVPDDGAGPRAGLPDKPRTVVTIATRARGPRTAARDWGWLLRFASRCAAFFGGEPPVAAEIALTLGMPRTAEAALERLMSEAGDETGAVRCSRLWLVSHDVRLRRLATSRLVRWSLASRAQDWLGWSLPWERVETWNRVPPRPASVAPPQAPQGSRIDRAANAAWAQEQPIAVQPGSSLPTVAAAVERHAYLVSQIGMTTRSPSSDGSARGVGRLSALVVRGQRLIGPCHERDGLEMGRESQGSPAVTGAEPASVGIGAVYLRGPDATARTLLPVHALREIASVGPPSQCLRRSPTGRLVDEAVIGRMSEQPLKGWGDLIPVGLCRESIDFRTWDLVAEARPGPAATPEGWWVSPGLGGSSANGTRRLPGFGRLLPEPFEIPAAVAAPRRGQLELRLTSPIWPDTPTVVESAVAPGTLGAGDGKGFPVAVLALGAPIGDEAICSPIQRFTATRLRAEAPTLGLSLDQWNELLRWPLVVPLKVGS